MDNTEGTPVVFPVRFPPDTEISEIDLDEEARGNFQTSVDSVRELLDACREIDGNLA